MENQVALQKCFIISHHYQYMSVCFPPYPASTEFWQSLIFAYLIG